jgi:FdhE protein
MLQKPAYREMYPFLEALFLIQLRVKEALQSPAVPAWGDLLQTRWAEGFPVCLRWEFPVDVPSAESVLRHIKDALPANSHSLKASCSALEKILGLPEEAKAGAWKTYLSLDEEPWLDPGEDAAVDAASLLFLARSCLRPSLEAYAEKLLGRFPAPQEWRRGYCPVCGSLPSLLVLQGEGERKGYCSWCGTSWELARFQCPYCDNRDHQSLGYLQIEGESAYRVQYCRLCRNYFKLIDTRELLEQPYLPLEEWKTLHLDLIAQREGWTQPPSPSPTVYSSIDRMEED